VNAITAISSGSHAPCTSLVERRRWRLRLPSGSGRAGAVRPGNPGPNRTIRSIPGYWRRINDDWFSLSGRWGLPRAFGTTMAIVGFCGFPRNRCSGTSGLWVNQPPSQLAPRVSHAQVMINRPSQPYRRVSPISAVAPRFVHKSVHNTARSKCSNRRLRAVTPELGYPDKRGARVVARSLRSPTHRPDPGAFLPAANGVQPAPHVSPEPQRARRLVS
jgi:hypothetical protein